MQRTVGIVQISSVQTASRTKRRVFVMYSVHDVLLNLSVKRQNFISNGNKLVDS